MSSPVSPSPFASRSNLAELSSVWTSWLPPHGCANGFPPHLQELKAETPTSNHEMQQFLWDSEAAMAKIRHLQHRICRLENQLEFLRSERDILERDLKHRETDFKSLKRENEKKLEAMQEKNFELSSRFREANNQCASLLGRIAELHETNTRMERDLRITQHLLELERNANSEVEVANAATSTEASTNTPTAPENTDALYVSASPAVRRRFVNSVHCSIDQNNNDDFVARSLWITGLTRDTKAIDLKKICKEFGKFIRAKVFEKQRSLACFGFVTMGDVAAAEKAIAALDAKQINGAVVSVRKADTLDTATLQMLTSAKTVRNDDPRVVNVTISNVNANSTIKKEDSKNSRPSRSFPLLPPRQHSHRTVSNVSACRRDSPPKVSSTHCRKPERSERSSFVAPPNPSRVSEQTSARAKKRRSNETLYLPSNRMTREEEALKKEREQLERDRRDLEEHRRKVELLITLQQQKLERASSPFASPHCSRHRSRSQHGQHRPQSKVRDRNRRDGLYSSHRYPTPIDRRISRSPPPLGDRYDGEWEAKERR
ncbi:hypothetical protein Aduo_013973 [Ancylostoma duodenale]